MPRTTDAKFHTVIDKNTYYFVNRKFEERYEIHLHSLKDKLLILKNKIDTDKLKKEYFEELLLEENGLIALLALTGFSNESFKRLLTFIRVIDNKELHTKLYLNKWNHFNELKYAINLLKSLKFIENYKDEVKSILKLNDKFNSFNIENSLGLRNTIRKNDRAQFKAVVDYCKKNFKYRRADLKKLKGKQFRDNIENIINCLFSNLEIKVEEWTDENIQFILSNNISFLKGIVNLFFEGLTIKTLRFHLPPFEIKKLSITKLSFSIEELIDSLIRYKEKGSYSGDKENNPEIIIENILDKYDLPYERGDLKKFIKDAPDEKRTMDFIIPSKSAPKIIIECSFLVTTSSGQGDKSKTEISIDALIKKHYSDAKFIGFVDGIGWYVRKGDLRRMVTAYEDVFTFRNDELLRFEKLLKETFGV